MINCSLSLEEAKYQLKIISDLLQVGILHNGDSKDTCFRCAYDRAIHLYCKVEGMINNGKRAMEAS